MRRFVREALADADAGQPVEDAELALAQPLVDDRPGRAAGERAGLADDLGGLARPHVGRGEDDLGPLVARQSGKPAAGRLGLAKAELGERHVDVADVDVDLVRAGLVGGVAGDIALALPVPHQPQPLGPILPHFALLLRTAQSISRANVPEPSRTLAHWELHEEP